MPGRVAVSAGIMAADEDGPAEALDRLETLQAMLAASLRLIKDIARDGLLLRWLDSYSRMRAADRPVIVDAVEREVKASVITRATEKVTGQSMHPNPHARLYLRSMDTHVPRGQVETEAMRRATLSGMRVVSVITQTPELFAQWRASTAEALTELAASERDAVEILAREFVRLLDGAVAAPSAPTPSAPEPSSPETPVARPRATRSRS